MKYLEQRKFFINQRDPSNAPKMAPAIEAVIELLSDDEPHAWGECIQLMIDVSSIQRNTAENILGNAIRWGFVVNTTSTRHRNNKTVHIVEWPEA